MKSGSPTNNRSSGPSIETPWLVLVHQFPKSPGSLRVKIWRQLQRVGAVSFKSSMYVLPNGPQAREDFEWILQEILAGGAEGAILESRLVDGLDDQGIRELFNTARNDDYAGLTLQLREQLADLPEKITEGERPEARTQLARLRRKRDEIQSIDFFGADGHRVVNELLRTLQERIEGDKSSPDGDRPVELAATVGRVWVTRRQVYVDRIASAWFVRRWIDPGAVFKFTAAPRYQPGPREIRFDMFEGEFTHEGDACTFEVLLRRAGIQDEALTAIAEIVHDIDLKDGKFGRSETEGIATILGGLAARTDDDDERLLRGGSLLDDLYAALGGTDS